MQFAIVIAGEGENSTRQQAIASACVAQLEAAGCEVSLANYNEPIPLTAAPALSLAPAPTAPNRPTEQDPAPAPESAGGADILTAGDPGSVGAHNPDSAGSTPAPVIPEVPDCPRCADTGVEQDVGSSGPAISRPCPDCTTAP